jgi:MbtH protein
MEEYDWPGAMSDVSANEQRFVVVCNGAGQYSIFPADRMPPPGWMDMGFAGTREACLDHIEQVWSDIRPLDLLRSLEPE